MSDPSSNLERNGLEIFDAPGHSAAPAAHPATRRPRWPGATSAALATLMVLTWALALVCALGGFIDLGLGLSISSLLLSGIAVIGGIVAVAGNWGRGWGAAAIAIGVLLNPVVLVYALGRIGAL